MRLFTALPLLVPSLLMFALLSACALPAAAKDWSQVVDRAHESVIGLRHVVNERSMASCTAWYVAEQYILTASHCFSDEWPELQPETGTVRLVHMNTTTDLALLHATQKGRPLKVANMVKQGEEVAILGYRGFDRFLFVGHVSGVHLDIFKAWPAGTLLDITGISGISGGPVLNAHGMVVGVALGGGSTTGSFSGLGYAASVANIQRAMAQMEQGDTQRDFRK